MVFSFRRKAIFPMVHVSDETLLAIRKKARYERDILQHLYNLGKIADCYLPEINQLGEIADQAEELYMRRIR